MSGGSWDYQYMHVEGLAMQLAHETNPKRRALGQHLKVCAEAARAIEWHDSSDYSGEQEDEAIEAALGPQFLPLVQAHAWKRIVELAAEIIDIDDRMRAQ